MAVRFFYIDESYNDDCFCLCALSIRHSHWKECFDAVRQHRVAMRKDFGVFLNKEIHAARMVGGRGEISSRVVTKGERAQLFLGLLQLVARLPSVKLFNVCLPNKGLADAQMVAWDRLVNRIERTMRKWDEDEFAIRTRLVAGLRTEGRTDEQIEVIRKIEKRLAMFRARAFIVADEGREKEITTALRKMHVHNPIPSQYGGWASGAVTKNITTDRIIEDPFFKASHRSYFLQLIDCAAFALLKQEVEPTPHVAKYGIQKMFRAALSDVCFKGAARNDPLGIVRA